MAQMCPPAASVAHQSCVAAESGTGGRSGDRHQLGERTGGAEVPGQVGAGFAVAAAQVRQTDAGDLTSRIAGPAGLIHV